MSFPPSPPASKIRGTTTNDAAAAGYVGELLSASLAIGDAVSLTNTTAANVMSLSLTPGDWDVWFDCVYNPGAATTITQLFSSISPTSATFSTTLGTYATVAFSAYVMGANTFGLKAGPTRISLAATTTYYGVAYAIFGVSTLTAFGIIQARRAR